MKIRMSYKCYFELFIFSALVLGLQGDSCSTATTCSECFRLGNSCSWCSDENFSRPRCNTKHVLKVQQCKNFDDSSYGKINPIEIVAGKYCECNNLGCDRFNHLLCGGEERGVCECGRCKCKEGFTGNNCGEKVCAFHQHECLKDGAICSNQGECECGYCACNARDDPREFISGKYCECDNFSCPRYNGLICGGEENGICECGKCICKKGFFGGNCGLKDCTIHERNCKKDGVTCSNQGRCVCGECICNARENPSEIIDGKFCECNNFACPRFRNKICGGEERGACECGKCNCRHGFTGDNCGEKVCAFHQSKCQKDGVTCSNNGECVCGDCNCNTGYYGKYCEQSVDYL